MLNNPTLSPAAAMERDNLEGFPPKFPSPHCSSFLSPSIRYPEIVMRPVVQISSLARLVVYRRDRLSILLDDVCAHYPYAATRRMGRN